MTLKGSFRLGWVLVLGLGCARRDPPTSQAARNAVNVRTAPAAVRDVVYKIRALGSLEAEEIMQVTAEVEGAVTAVAFHEGDHVTPDTVLARIDPERRRLEAEQAEASYRRALADRHRAEDDYARRQELAREQLVSAEDLIRARQEAERLSADAAAAKATWDLALQNVSRSDLRPARSGVINTRNVDTGQFVKSGTVLATLVDTSRLRLRFKVSESESLRARTGDTVTFRVASLADRDFPARIYHVGEVADATTRQVEVLAWVRNPGPLKPGFFAEVTLATESHKGALVVPEGAIQASDRGFIAFVVDQGVAHRREVGVGLRSGTGIVEILSGLRGGETVVIEGSDRLADGVSVTPAEDGPNPKAASAP